MKREMLGTATMYLGDCLEVMESLERVDAVITDPPYCSGAVSEASRTAAPGQGLRTETLQRFGWFVGDNMGTAGLVFLLRSMAFRAVDLIQPSGSMLTFCDWRMVPNLAPAIESAGMRYQNMVVWDKENMAPEADRWALPLSRKACGSLALSATADTSIRHARGSRTRSGKAHCSRRTTPPRGRFLFP